jgi:hypothetical protein
MLARLVAFAALGALATGAFAQAGPHCAGDGRCRVKISVDAGPPCSQATIRVDPEGAEMGRSAGNRTIVWRLDTPGFRFCDGDGIRFKSGDVDFQFFGPAATDNDNGDDDAHGGCKRNFRWRNKNEPHTFGKRYDYLIRFTGPNGQACVRDPFIRNG